MATSPIDSLIVANMDRHHQKGTLILACSDHRWSDKGNSDSAKAYGGHIYIVKNLLNYMRVIIRETVCLLSGVGH